MRPVVTPAEMAAIDAAAPEPVEELIERAGWATARAAIGMLGGSLYGRRIAVLAGRGNNGADGRSAARFLERAGGRCTVFDIPLGSARSSAGRPAFDLVIDACYGTGLGRDFDRDGLPLDVGDIPVLAVDIPSGVDGLTGQLRGRPLPATATVTFAALKPGLLLDPGRRLAGAISTADIGLDCSGATTWHLGSDDITALWPRRPAEAHKWQRAVHVIGGSPGLTGAPTLASSGALRAGAGYVARSVPLAGPAGPTDDRPPDSDRELIDSLDHVDSEFGPVEAVNYPVPPRWAGAALATIDRFGAAVVGPGLHPGRPLELAAYLNATTIPTVFDAGAIDGLTAVLAREPNALRRPDGPLHVVTPHDGEFTRLIGHRPGTDRIAAAVEAAARLRAVVLLKGSTTVVAHPDGRVLLSTAGDQRLATAGTGDVLAGVIGAGLAGGLDPFLAAGVGSEIHGRAGFGGYRVGMTAGDLPSLIAALLSELV
ncbi:MAG: bifunctional ADP-dependent NAD(P)H-hydrate dehydratase/NAD(P)H-hydrate epimerase [Acidimicrobiales bacterium]